MNHNDNPQIDVLTLISAAVERQEHGCETDLTSLAARSLVTDPYAQVWCSCSRDGKSHELKTFLNVSDSYVAARSYDLAFGTRGSSEPERLIQLKYDKGLHKLGKRHEKTYAINTARNHALRDLVNMAVDWRRLRGTAECHVVSVVHQDNLSKEHRWQPFLQEEEWTFVCEPSQIAKVGRPRGGFVDAKERRIQPDTLGQANEVFGTRWQSLGYGLFARPGILTITFRSRSRIVGDFAVIDWELIDASLTGTTEDLERWLP